MNDKYERLQLLACEKGTPAGRIDKWRTTLQNGFILQCNDKPVQTIAQLQKIIKECDKEHLTLKIGTIDKQALHPQKGVPQLYFDQLNHIGQHLFQMKYDPEWQSDELTEAYAAKATINGIIPKGRQRGEKLTRKKLMKQDDWDDWKKAEF